MNFEISVREDFDKVCAHFSAQENSGARSSMGKIWLQRIRTFPDQMAATIDRMKLPDMSSVQAAIIGQALARVTSQSESNLAAFGRVEEQVFERPIGG